MGSLLKKLKRNQRKGSKTRCHWVTPGDRWQVASRLTALTEPGLRVRSRLLDAGGIRPR